MFKIRSHIIMLAFLAVTVMLWGVFFNLQEEEKVYAIACGETITANTTLTADLVSCTGGGLIMGADSITLNCNGFTIGGTGVGVTITNRISTVVENCIFDGFIIIYNS